MIRHAPSIGIGIGISLRSQFAGFSGLLDTYPGAAFAASLRALSSGWLAGDVVEVRRSSDSATQDFTASQILNGDLVTFCGAGDGFVSTWYDQSGNANNLIQATPSEQRKIVDAGVLVTEGGDPAIAGNIYGMQFTSGVVLSGEFSILMLANINNQQSTLGASTNNPRIRFNAENIEMVNDSGGEINFANTDNPPSSHDFLGTKVLVAIYRDAADSIDATIAGQSVASGPFTLVGDFSFTQAFARAADVDPMSDNFQEMIIWPSDIR